MTRVIGLALKGQTTLTCLAAVLFVLPAAFADIVVLLDDVTNGVTVRKSASSNSTRIGVLNKGEEAQLLGSVPNWHRIKLTNGQAGFVSKRWTRVKPSAPPSTAEEYTMDVVDVGTGLGILVRGPDFTLVYDAGSNDDLARGAANRMLAYIKAVAPNAPGSSAAEVSEAAV
jgi:beta-lactamase superfamily II metal-dependent hydrolase